MAYLFLTDFHSTLVIVLHASCFPSLLSFAENKRGMNSCRLGTDMYHNIPQTACFHKNDKC